MKRLGLLTIISLTGTWLAGCSTVSEEAVFDNVADTVSKRIQQKILWPRTPESEKQVAELVITSLKDGLSEPDAIRITLLNNRDLRAKFADLGISRAALLQANLLPNPVLDAVIKYPLDGDPANLDLGLTFQFLNLITMPTRQRIAESELQEAKISLVNDIIAISALSRAAYFNFQAAQQSIAFLEQSISAGEASVEAIKTLRRAGNVTPLEVANEEFALASLRLDLADARADLLVARERLNTLMGLSGAQETSWQVKGRLRRPPRELLDLDALTDRALRNNLSLQLTKQKIVTLEEALGLTEITSVIGDLDVGAEAEREEKKWQVGPALELPLPLFDFGQAKRAKARLQLEKFRNIHQAVTIEVRSNVRKARARLEKARATVQMLRRQLLPLSRVIVNQTLRQYNAMQLGVLRLLRAKQQQISTGRRYILALREYWLARAGVEALMVGVMPDTIGASGGATSSAPLTLPDEGGH